MPLAESAASGDRAQALRDLRDLLAESIASCESMRDLAALSGRFQAVMVEIAALEPEKPKGDGIDEIAARRAARRPRATKGASSAKRTS